jgi:AmiR/NasT family two-component response regulator
MSAAHPLRVLIVEQEGIVARDTQQIVAGLGYDAFATACSAEQAFVEASKRCPDVMLIDMGLNTDLDGTSATMFLRQRFNAPIIYLAAQADKPTIALVNLPEPYGYVMKPVKAEELRVAIETAMHRHRIDEALKESYQQLVAVFENIAEGVVVTSISGTFTHCNPAASGILGREPTEAPPAVCSHEFNLFRPAGITEIRQAPQELAAATEALRISDHEFERIAAVASHHLHESLSTVTSFVELLARRYGDLLNADGRDSIAHALDGTRHMEKEIARLLALARVRRGAIPPRGISNSVSTP